MVSRTKSRAHSAAVVEVLIDSVGLSKVFSYSIPERFVDRLGVGCYVSVKLGNSTVRGWVVGRKELSADDLDALQFELSPISRLLGGGPTAEVIALCKWAAWRFVGSPVSFMTHASPKRRVSARAVYGLDFESCQDQFFRDRGESLVVRIPPAHSRIQWLIDYLAAGSRPAGTVIVSCPTQASVRYFARRLSETGHHVAVFPEEFEEAMDNADIVVGARNAVFASVGELSEIVIVDSDDPAHTETSSPAWSSYVVARARVARGHRAIMLSSAPTLDMLHGSKSMSLSRLEERSGWPKVMAAGISDGADGTVLVSSDLLRQIDIVTRGGVRAPTVTAEGLINYDGVIVLYNRLGGARVLMCKSCGRVIRCESCSTTLVQAPVTVDDAAPSGRKMLNRNAKEGLALAALTCPRCKRSYPVICTNCFSTSLKVMTFGINRFRGTLQAALGRPVTEVSAASEIQLEALADVTIGTEAVFSRFRSARMVAIADFDQYLYAPTLSARESSFSLVARAARLVPPRSHNTGYVPLYIQARDLQNPVIKAAVAGDPRQIEESEAEMRRRLALPPYGGIVRVFGSKALQWIVRSGLEDNPTIAVVQVQDGVFDLRGDSMPMLLDALSRLRSKVSYSGVRFSAIPD